MSTLEARLLAALIRQPTFHQYGLRTLKFFFSIRLVCGLSRASTVPPRRNNPLAQRKRNIMSGSRDRICNGNVKPSRSQLLRHEEQDNTNPPWH